MRLFLWFSNTVRYCNFYINFWSARCIYELQSFCWSNLDKNLYDQCSKAWTMLKFASFIFLLSFFSITLIDGGNVVRWNRYGRRVEKWGVYPDSCYVSCNDKRLTSTLYVAENDEKCMSWANFNTRDYSTFNLMELTNWKHICVQPVIK